MIKMEEIERKFLIKMLPDLSKFKKSSYERYFLFRNKDVEIRIQTVGNKYELERKVNKNNLSSEKHKFDITKDEFNALKKFPSESIIRDSYLVSTNPEVTIKIYKGKFNGLKRAEVEFKSLDEAKKFVLLDWFGKEITDTNLGRDSELLELSEEEFHKLLEEHS